jgi:methylenetetrahydrofolate reductase (NADPH)
MKAGSNLEKVLESGAFAVTAELGPPKSADPEVIIKKGNILKGYADAVNITDNQTAIVRMSSIAAGAILIKEGLPEPVMQMVTRDRNRIAMQSDILGASALGIKNILCLAGDHQCHGNHPGSKNVYVIDSIQLVSIVKAMRDDKAVQCGEAIEGVAPKMFIGAASTPLGDPKEFRALRLAKKVNAGADFIQTQAVYDVTAFAKFMEQVRDMGLHEKTHILVGIIPIKSAGMARYMDSSVPGVSVPGEIMDRMKGLKGKEAGREGVKIAVELIQQVREIKGVHGVHIMAIEWEDRVPEIVEGAGLLPRPNMRDA